jgi:hypothetical protein
MFIGEFNSLYMSNRWRIDSTSTGSIFTTQNSILSDNRLSEGFQLLFGYNPLPGMAFETSILQHFNEYHCFVNDTSDQPAHTDFSLSFAINDSLIKYIRYGDIYLRQEHSGLYPGSSSWFSSWGFGFGASIITAPIVYGLGLDASISFSNLDMNFNNRVDPEDGLFRFSLGILRTF